MKLTITKTFDFAHRGCDVVRYEKGQEIDTDDAELIATCKAEGWAKPGGKKAEGNPPENKSAGNAPENKSAGAAAQSDDSAAGAGA